MRMVFLLLMAMLVIKTTSAQGQGACSQSYVSCVDKCVGKPSQSLQGSCIESCQSQNNVCAGKAFGGDNLSAAKTVPANEPMAAQDQAKAPKGAKPAAQAKPAAAPAGQMAAPAKPAAERRPQ